ncbi:hypothetical protein PPL_11339 [Heterostelium album PN500]|uniref:Aerobactin siderophore biosynthesis IucA/IucC N-terminal domain-containing protein n=1 Tax=Heterostelium pallidum (strain ATCC 26659 / Pp 5 / PN500) TaxID=670386 RepID=D3BT47_HETP5|nr:hypothetical protein PPL_11339 [Heterostelium album PN500]EFA75264.1 hypothetical protein PPL_11339 [Heterostelium album PN500]|eukprot:XP_020427398.1 hypothetical protein PPL_11339 [Heterostelium album PN500]
MNFDFLLTFKNLIITSTSDFNFIKSNHNIKTTNFLNYFVCSEQSSFDKLFVSIIREQLLPFTSIPLILQPNSINIFQNKSSSCDNVHELSFKINKLYGFQFFSFEHPVKIRSITNNNNNNDDDDETVVVVDSCLDLIELLRENASYSDIDKFKEEINSLNYLSEYADFKSKQDNESYFDKFLFYDQLHVLVQYSYELKKQLPIRFIGLHKSVGRYSMIDMNDNPTDYFFRLFPSFVKESIQSYCTDNQLNIEDYLICPMYPFQDTNTLPSQFQEELDNLTLVIFPESIQLPSYPTAPVRNLIPLLPGNHSNNYTVPHIKFSIPIQLTNFVRLLPNDYIPICTSISKVLTKISSLEGSPFNERVIFLQELGGIYHSNEELRYQNFGTI